MFSNRLLHMDTRQCWPSSISSVKTLDAIWMICQERWMIGSVGEKESQGSSCCQFDLMIAAYFSIWLIMSKEHIYECVIIFTCETFWLFLGKFNLQDHFLVFSFFNQICLCNSINDRDGWQELVGLDDIHTHTAYSVAH